MNIRISGSPPNAVIVLEAECAAEQCQLEMIARQGSDPKTRADIIKRDDTTLIVRIETRPT